MNERLTKTEKYLIERSKYLDLEKCTGWLRVQGKREVNAALKLKARGVAEVKKINYSGTDGHYRVL